MGLDAASQAELATAAVMGSISLIYLGMPCRSSVPPYYFLLHPVSTAMFTYTRLRSMFLTLWNDGIVWRGTKYGRVVQGVGLRRMGHRERKLCGPFT